MGRPSPFRTKREPAMKVVPTAPIPGKSTPSLPVAGLGFGRVISIFRHCLHSTIVTNGALLLLLGSSFHGLLVLRSIQVLTKLGNQTL